MSLILSPVQVRVLGSLMEKEKATPEYYPMTINSIVNACNQKSNRNPVVDYDNETVEITINELREKKFIARITGASMRVPKYKQIFTDALSLSDSESAVMCILMVRGPQTIGEIKGRTGRLFQFDSLNDVLCVTENLMNREEPLITKLPKTAGMKDNRYAHLLTGKPEVKPVESIAEYEGEDKLNDLENEIQNLRDEIKKLKDEFEKFKKQFE